MKFWTFALLTLLPLAAFADPIDLTRNPIYFRAGFDPLWIQSIPQQGWREIPGSNTGKRRLQIRELTGHHRSFLSWESGKPAEFTFVTSFEFTRNSHILPALLIGRLGMNWEIYLNGKRVHSEMHPTANGGIENRSRKNLLVPFDGQLLIPGKNILAFRIIGDPAFEDTGFYLSSPYLIGSLQELSRIVDDTIHVIIISLYCFVGLFHLALFLRRRNERFNLFFALFTIDLFLYFFQHTERIYSVLSDSTVIYRIDIASVILILPLAASFLDSLFHLRLSIFTKFGWIFTGLLFLFCTFAPLTFVEDILRIWQISIPASLAYCLFVIFRELKAKIWEYRSIYSLPPIRATLRAMVRSPAGNLLIGALICSIAVAVELHDVFTEARGITPTLYALLLFVGGGAMILANRIMEVHKKVEVLNQDMRDRLEELQIAHEKIKHSEEKYKQLIEGSNEIIFTLDSNLVFKSLNKSVHRHLGFQVEDLIGTRFFDLLFQGDLESGLAVDLINRRMLEFVQEGKAINLKIQLKAKYTQEPREFSVRLEKIAVNGATQILGKAMLVLEDSLLRYFVRENQKYVMGNYLTAAEELSQRIVRNLEKYLDLPRVTAIRIGLREILINAIEHGNLAITYDDKTRELSSGNYLEFIQARQADPVYRDRKVVVEYELTTINVTYTITDDGAGFDHAAMKKREADAADAAPESHGRGIVVTENAFDEVIYNDAGNSVRLIKHFRR
ncbi:MAG: ATP-binding protein [Leptospirales bacterium]|nr:ATP-binding protein [Leptospirales bacterium]